ncbi:MAG: hypothetical protein AMXMBFR84_41410 [Candidatus Hydrogenedentota bacterium]
MDTIRVGFVGLGGICRQRHVPNLRKLDGVELTVVCNRTRASSERAAKEFGIPLICETWDQVVRHPDVDAVFIGTWPYLHKPIALEALRAGKHVFCQARMAMDLAEAREMYDFSRSAGRVAAICPAPIGMSIDDTIRRRLLARSLGDVRLVRVQSLSNVFATPVEPIHWRKDHRLSGLNMHTLGIYVEVIHRWFGWTRSVSAQTHTYTHHLSGAKGERVDVQIPDLVLINAEMQSGVPVQYVFSTAVHHGGDRIEIYGSDMTLQYEVEDDLLYGAKPGEYLGSATMTTTDSERTDPWRVELDFINAIRKGTEYHPDFYEGMKYMQVVQAVHDSARDGKTVVLENL